MKEKQPIKKSPTIPSANLSTWLPESLIQSVKQLALDSQESPTDFVKRSLENEVSRRTLPIPERQLSLKDIKLKLDQVSEQQARREVSEREILATLQVIAVAMGVSV